MVADASRALPATISHDAFFESARSLAGITLSQQDAHNFSWRLAGNIDMLISGNPVLPWTKQSENEWVPVQVTHVYAATRGRRSGYNFKCRVLAGSSCAIEFDQFISKGSCAAIAYSVGFSHAMPFTNALYFANLRMLVEIDAEKSEETPQFQHVTCTASMRKWNKAILAIRTRTALCPQDFTHQCEQCVFGYADCPASVFPIGLEQRMCASCSKEQFFSPARSVELCLSCLATAAIKQAVSNS